jgi:ligand-binding sensor protein
MAKKQKVSWVDKWQTIQDNFSSITGICLRTFGNDCKPLTKPSNPPKFCAEITNHKSLKAKLCGPCLPTFLGGKGIVDKNLGFLCDAGLCNFAAPLKGAGNRTRGYVIAGPVILVKRKPKEDYRDLAEELNVPLETLWNELLEIKVMSFHTIQSLLKLIQEIAAYTIEKTVSLPGKLKNLLDVLLDVACELASADTGSVMLLNKKRGELAIKSSKGISGNIVKEARVEAGRGVSGTALKENHPFLIDDYLQDNRLKPYLNQPQLGSSMILPFNIEQKIMGVLNLGALRSSSVRFTAKNLTEIDRLLSVTTESI